MVATPEKIGMVSSSSISADISESQLISIEKEKEFHGTEIGKCDVFNFIA